MVASEKQESENDEPDTSEDDFVAVSEELWNSNNLNQNRRVDTDKSVYSLPSQ
jgi:hypothetical protein